MRNFRGGGNILYLDCGNGIYLSNIYLSNIFFKTYRNVYLRRVNFIFLKKTNAAIYDNVDKSGGYFMK